MHAAAGLEWETDGHAVITLILPVQAGLNEAEEQVLTTGTHNIVPVLMSAAGLDPSEWDLVDTKGYYRPDHEGNMMAVMKIDMFNQAHAGAPEMV